jgi:hypothetical protein
MPGRRTDFYYFLTGIALIPVFFSSCSLDNGPGQDFVETPITLEVLAGANAVDTVEAHVPIRLLLVPDDDETPRPLRLNVQLLVLGEDCGETVQTLPVSDQDDEINTTWILGNLAGECSLEARVFSPDGTALGFISIDAKIEPGQPVEGGFSLGQVERAADSLAMSQGDLFWEDRFGNEVPWRIQVVSGPIVVLDNDFSDDGSRTLIATGEGSGEVDFLSLFGAIYRASVDVCTFEDKKWIRVFRSEDATTVLSACP